MLNTYKGFKSYAQSSLQNKLSTEQVRPTDELWAKVRSRITESVAPVKLKELL